MDPHSCPAPLRVINRRRQRAHALIGATALAVSVACGDPYLHTNPYDPVYPVAFTITGPDTLFSFAEVGQYAVQTSPSWADSGVVWTVDTFTDYFIPPPPPKSSPMCWSQVTHGDTALKGNGTGAYQAILPPLEPYVFKIAISVWLGTIDTTVINNPCSGVSGAVLNINAARHFGYKTVVITQRITRIQLRCPDTHACGPLTVGDSAFTWVDAFDALGHPPAVIFNPAANPADNNPPFPNFSLDSAIARPPGTNTPIVTYASRDPTIASATSIGIRVAKVTALKAGSTWVVGTRGALLDSLQIVVH